MPRKRQRDKDITPQQLVPDPALTFPAGLPTAVIEVIVAKSCVPVAVPAFAPVIDSETAVPVSSVPTAVKDIPLSLPALRIVMFLGASKVTDPAAAKAPPITSAALLATAAAVDIPFGSAAAAVIKLDVTSLPEPLMVIVIYLL
jgi:hypothetical protein|tara:strand:- start:61 stop:492 length:432 start_codon:yes stop_codon:yes gene_type:complete